MTLSCDHIYCPNGCTVSAGMCEACVRKALAEQRKKDAEIIGNTESDEFASLTNQTDKLLAWKHLEHIVAAILAQEQT